MKARGWQVDALRAWLASHGRGTVTAPTGAGKTVFCLSAIKSFSPRPSVLIVVPTINLQEQWMEELVKDGCPREKIGRVGGGFSEWEKKYVVGVINSVRDSSHSKDLLILDEVHHAVADINAHVLNRSFKHVLCVSATLERSDGRHALLDAIAPIVYSYSLQDSVSDGVVNDFEIINIGLQLDAYTQVEVLKLNELIKKGNAVYGGMFEVYAALRRGDWGAKPFASAVTKRKTIFWTHHLKVDRCVQVIRECHLQGDKAIVFCETIAVAEQLRKLLEGAGIASRVYHSKMKPLLREGCLEGFKRDEFKVLVSVRCLDEGVNVPDADVAVILGGGRSERQIKQRVGRILRKKDGRSKVFQFYFRGTLDEEWIKARTRVLKGAASGVVWV